MNKSESFANARINWYPGHMAKTKKQIVEDLKLVDLVIELLDARIPVSSQNPDIGKFIADKKRIIVLNKSDLADQKETKKWINFFNEKNIPALEVDSNQGKGINQVLKIIEKTMEDILKQESQKGRIRKTIRAMIVGIPNVGKSSFINRISNKSSLTVGNKPGVTKQKQWIRIGNQIELLDTPGVLWPKFESEEVALNLAYIGSIKDEIIDKVEVCYHLIKFLEKNYRENLIEKYKITTEEIEQIRNHSQYIYELMQLIGRKRGAIVSGGRIDDNKVANLVLDDFRSGKIGNITLEQCQ